MSTEIDEVFEICGVLVMRVRTSVDGAGLSSCYASFEQHGAAIMADGGRIFEVPLPAPERSEGRRRRAQRSPRQEQSPQKRTYLFALASDAVRALRWEDPVTIALRVGSTELCRASVRRATLDLGRLDGGEFRSTLAEALRAFGAREAAAILSARVRVASADQCGTVRITRTAFAQAGLVLEGWVGPQSTPEIRLATGDLRYWTSQAQVAVRPTTREQAVHQPNTNDQVEDTPGTAFTAVLSCAPSGAKEKVYLVTYDKSDDVSVFYGPLEVAEVKDGPEAAQIVRSAFGPIQGLPGSHIDQIYRPVLACPKNHIRAQRLEFGPPISPGEPLSSIIIPFYGDAFFLNCVYHLQRVLDEGFELILVIDDPNIWAEVHGRLSARRSSFTVPTTVLQCAGNYGYAPANNLGSQAARGDVLFLMNSDVLITDPTSLREAAAVIRERRKLQEAEVVIGFSLLYEDDSIQHVGMEFLRSPAMGDMYVAHHPMKGLPFALYEGARVQRVPAVTGALMALSSSLYRSLGGLDPIYERGDFEDADLCLRARRIGAEVQLHVAPGLYHLERQSMRKLGDHDLRAMVTYMNCATFNARWERYLAQQPFAASASQGLRPGGRQPVQIRKRHRVSIAGGSPQPAHPTSA